MMLKDKSVSENDIQKGDGEWNVCRVFEFGKGG